MGIHWAMIYDQPKHLEPLIKNGGDREVFNMDGATPLMGWAELGGKEGVEALLRAGASPQTQHQVDDNNTALHLAAKVRKFDTIEALLADRRTDKDARNARGET